MFTHETVTFIVAITTALISVAAFLYRIDKRITVLQNDVEWLKRDTQQKGSTSYSEQNPQ